MIITMPSTNEQNIIIEPSWGDTIHDVIIRACSLATNVSTNPNQVNVEFVWCDGRKVTVTPKDDWHDVREKWEKAPRG